MIEVVQWTTVMMLIWVVPSSASRSVARVESGAELLAALRGGSTEVQLASHVRLGAEWASADVVLRQNVTLSAQTRGTRLDLNYEAWKLRVEPGAWLHIEGLELMRTRHTLPGLGGGFHLAAMTCPHGPQPSVCPPVQTLQVGPGLHEPRTSA